MTTTQDDPHAVQFDHGVDFDDPDNEMPICDSAGVRFPWLVQAVSDEFVIQIGEGIDLQVDGPPPECPHDEAHQVAIPGCLSLTADIKGINGWGHDAHAELQWEVWPAPVVERFARALLAAVEEVKRTHPDAWSAKP